MYEKAQINMPVYEAQTLQIAPFHRPCRITASSAFYWKVKGNRDSGTLCSYFGILQSTGITRDAMCSH
jgi:hypothetical protein